MGRAGRHRQLAGPCLPHSAPFGVPPKAHPFPQTSTNPTHPRIGFICPIRPITTPSIAHWWPRRKPVLPNKPISQIHNSLSINWNQKPCVSFSYKNEPKYDDSIVHLPFFFSSLLSLLSFVFCFMANGNGGANRSGNLPCSNDRMKNQTGSNQKSGSATSQWWPCVTPSVSQLTQPSTLN